MSALSAEWPGKSQSVTLKKGVGGGKATGAVLTAGMSLSQQGSRASSHTHNWPGELRHGLNV